MTTNLPPTKPEDRIQPRNSSDSLKSKLNRAGLILIGLFLTSIGAGTLFKFFDVIKSPVGATILEWIVSCLMVLMFGVVPIAAGCAIIFRGVGRLAETNKK